MPARYRSDRFVGRAREISRLAVSLEAAAEGQSRRLLIAGPGGVGVSRLIDESILRVGRLSEPFAVLRWRAWAGRTREPYAPVIAGLRAYLSGLEAGERARILGPGADAIATLAPDLGGTPPAPRALRVGEDRRAAWVAEAVMRTLERIGERRPVLLALEDLHLADAATRALAVFLARVSRPSRVCTIATYGTDNLVRGDPFLADVAAIAEIADPPDRLELGPLGPDELADLVAGIEGERPTAALLLLVAERSGGNPLLVEEVLAARRELSGVSLGSSLGELVAARLALRSHECRRALRLLAPVGEPVDRATLQGIADAWERAAEGLPPRSGGTPRKGADGLDADLRAGVEEGLEGGFLVESPGGDIQFRHELVGAAIEADLLPFQRRRYHAALAVALDDRPGALVDQRLRAHDILAARDAALELATLAEVRGAPADRLAALELAMDLGAADLGDRPASGHLLLGAADAAMVAGQPGRAEAYLEAAAARFGEREDRRLLATLHDRLGRVARTLGNHERALSEHRKAASLVPAGTSVLRAQLLGSLAQTLMLLGTFGEAETVARRAIAAAQVAGSEAGTADPDAQAVGSEAVGSEAPLAGPAAQAADFEARAAEGHATCTLGIARAWGADPATAIGLLESARDIAREVGNADDYFRAVLNLTTALTLLHRGAEAIGVTGQAIEQARSDGLETVYGNTLRGNVAEALFLTGRWAEARDALRTALEWSPAADAFADAAITSAMLEVESASGERAARLLGGRLLELRNAPDPQSVVPASRAAASFSLWRGDLGDAARAAELGWSAVRGTEDWVLLSRMAATYLEVQAAIVADAGDRRAIAELGAARERAKIVLGIAEAALRASGVPADASSRGEAEAQLATARAFAARIDGREIPAAWDAVARTWERVGDPYQVARARWRQAEATLISSDDARSGRAAGRAPLLEAVRIARELGARPLLRELEALAGRALITLPPDPSATVPQEGPAPRERVAGDAVASPVTVAVPGGSVGVGIAHAFVGPSASRPDPVFGLSNREREVLGQIVLGHTNREIGERLFISQKTVGVHVGNILAKLGVSGRVEAAMVAVRLDLVAPRGR